MPLAFTSSSHGRIAFGFFNIQIDMLLLEELFFFADQFCNCVVELSEAQQSAGPLPGWRIAQPERIGNLHGAIDGADLSGFIGATYERWPFPSRPEDFKQSPAGIDNQAPTRELIDPFGQPETIPIVHHPKTNIVTIGEYAFTAPVFSELVAYVDRGGYPRWKEERRPDYVVAMTKVWARTNSDLRSTP
jgi:hypothetical protein